MVDDQEEAENCPLRRRARYKVGINTSRVCGLVLVKRMRWRGGLKLKVGVSYVFIPRYF
jgi:hypothetical protein